MEIIPLQDRPSIRGNPQYFTGTVWVEPIVHTSTAPRLRALRVTFEPGARTAWHTHPFGQVLHVVSGLGRARQEGGPLLTLQPGDTVVIKPGERHWHGAAPGHAMVHLAMQNGDDAGNDVAWLEPVTEAEYEGLRAES